jgi:O-antigen/teichoic acid export membrane protein
VVRRLTWQLDTVLLGLLQPPAVVGIYSVGYRPLGPLNWLPQTISWAWFPSFARLAVENPAELKKPFAHSIRLLWISSLPIAVAICMCAEPIVLLIAGPEYLEAAIPMRLLIWIATFTFLSVQFRFVFTAVGRQRLFAWLVIGVFILEAVIELALIPRWGYFGACAGSLGGELVLTLAGLALCVYLGAGEIDWLPMASATLAGGVMAAVLWMVQGLPLPLLACAVMAATGVYVFVCLLLGALTRDDMQRLYEAFRGTSRSRRNAPGPAPVPPA